MITYKSSRQLSLDGLHMPFGGKLNPENRWVNLSEIIPWDPGSIIGRCGRILFIKPLVVFALIFSKNWKLLLIHILKHWRRLCSVGS